MALYAQTQNMRFPSSALPYKSANAWYTQYTAQNTSLYVLPDTTVPYNMSSGIGGTTGDAQFAMNPMSLDTLSKPMTSFNRDTTVPYKMSPVFVTTAGDAQFAMKPMSLDALSNSTRSNASPIGSLSSLSPSSPVGSLNSLKSESMAAQNLLAPQNAASLRQPVGSLNSESMAAQNLPAPQNAASLRQPVGSLQSESMAAQNLPVAQNAASLRQSIAKDDIQLVSLGCACGTKLAFQEMGRGAESLPFDSITTTSEGILNFLRSGFQGFFNFERKAAKNVGGASITAYRSKQHGFWHDDPTLPATQEKYNRRIKRMQTISAHSQPVLFVRLAATSEEIRTVDQFLSQLISQFGPNAHLLLIIDCQDANAPGPCAVKGLDNLLIHYLSGLSAPGFNKFCGPIDTALDWAAKKPVRCGQVQDLAAAQHLAKPVTPGYYGMGGMAAFEGIPDQY